ncbi:MAG TPA: carbon monoxide dehydrogenase [Blastocatellia bacterium]|jgi:carbon-monoxide dehydrogenase large subunit|nr:carbon monoxide dehydrogenase [Blastocatellia bacterium]HAF23273.1 carbon monoxide dehydrogenase [Blastocatellia bacterium]HCX28354.1 carbon monoxide dehydrogenase [Blastocatellia bacterium]
MANKYVGQRIKRTEDPRLIKGLAHYVDDIRLPDTLHVAFVRSLYAHARINGIDASEALKASGVVAVYTGKDVAKVGPVPCASALPGLKVPDYRVLAQDKVFFVGHPIAAVVATDAYSARDAIDLVVVDYEDLPPVVDVEEAAKGGTIIHEDFGDNIAYKLTAGEGDIDAALAGADKVIKQRIVHQRLAPIAMEGRGVLARYFPGEEELTVWSSTQIPHLLRTQLALMIGIPENKLRVITPEVGGAFGSKLNVYAEEALLGWISIKLGKPVKWIEGRRENIQATIHGRGQVGYVEIGCKNDGTITGLRYNVFADLGAYHQLLTPAIPTLTGLMLSGAYKIPAIQINITGCFTNKMATDAYRGAGRPEATYVVERAMDLVAAELGIDPAELRRRNFPAAAEFPFHTATGLDYDSGNYEAALNKAQEMIGYAKLRDEQKKAREEGRLLGIGISTYVEICALGPSQAMPAGGWESATVRIEPTGKVTVLTGASPHGQGQETSFAQIAADELGVDLNDVTVIHGDTGIVQYGIGTFGSRATAVGGTAVLIAIQKLKEKANKIAAHMLKTDAASLAFEGGRYSRQAVAAATTGVSEPVVPVGEAPAGALPQPETEGKSSLTIQDIALAAHLAKELPPDTEPGLSATYFFEPKNFTFPFGTHIVVVEVERETGDVKFLRYVAVDDCGKVINPMLVDGQIQGGIVQSIGQALYEEVVYDDQGQLVTGSLMDYAIPRATHVPWLELDRTETPSPVNPLGVKGVGEAGTIGATPAIVGAIVDAMSPFGVRHLDMPVKPEALWRIINQ